MTSSASRSSLVAHSPAEALEQRGRPLPLLGAARPASARGGRGRAGRGARGRPPARRPCMPPTARGACSAGTTVDQREQRVDGAEQRVHGPAVGALDRRAAARRRSGRAARGRRRSAAGGSRGAAYAPCVAGAQPVEHPAVFGPQEAVGTADQRRRQLDRGDVAVDDHARRRRSRAARARRRARAPWRRSIAARRAFQRCAQVRRWTVARSGALRIAQAPAPSPFSSAERKRSAALRTQAICSGVPTERSV